jgi:hypothetical protein
MNLDFKLWLEQQLQNANQLPPIPSGFARLTHFTNDRTAKIILSGQNLNYKKQGIVTTTADTHSNNEQVWKTIVDGKYGAFGRSDFGNAVLLIDLTFYEAKMHGVMGMAPGFIENRKIIGVLDRNVMTFQRNVNYRPQGNQAPGQVVTQRNRMAQQPVAVPQPTANPSSDVW